MYPRSDLHELRNDVADLRRQRRGVRGFPCGGFVGGARWTLGRKRYTFASFTPD
jgi:hypothetical protein